MTTTPPGAPRAASLPPDAARESSPLLPKPTPSPPSPPTPTRNTLTPLQAAHVGQDTELSGYYLMAASCIGFSAMSFLVHVAEDRFGFAPIASVFVRAVVQTALSLAFILRMLPVRDTLRGLSQTQWKLLIFRGVTGAFGIVALFTALQKLPVGDAVTLFFCGPVITMILSNLLLSEPITFVDSLAALASFVGVVLISRPGFGPFSAAAPVSPHDRFVGTICALTGAFLSSVAYVTVRSLGTAIHFMFLVFSLGFASLIVSIIFGGVLSPVTLFRQAEGALILVLSAFCAFFGQCCLNKGLQQCRAGPGVLIRNLDVPIAYLLGLLFLGERPSVLRLFGSLLVLASAVMIGLRQILGV